MQILLKELIKERVSDIENKKKARNLDMEYKLMTAKHELLKAKAEFFRNKQLGMYFFSYCLLFIYSMYIYMYTQVKSKLKMFLYKCL